MVRKISKESKIPLYHQIKEDLRARIEEGEWLPGKLIPAEKELCAEYKVSKITVLEAIKGLVGEGLLKRKQGKGTFESRVLIGFIILLKAYGKKDLN